MLGVELRLGGLISIQGKQIAFGQTLALLDAIVATRSVSGAAQRLELSYRTVWDRVEALQAAFGQPLVVKTKGHGSTLSPTGLQLREALGAVLRDFEAPLASAEASLTQQLEAIIHAAPGRAKAAVSHDPLLLEALGAMTHTIDATTMGSSDAVAALLGGEVELAGFHFGMQSHEPPPGSVFRTLFDDERFAVTPLFRREQGLMLAAGNPLQIRSIRDLCSTHARFVNRQKGSGTRLWFDRLLTEAGLSSSQVQSYTMEEFTHQAVAAMVASGAADAGMGVRPAAEKFGLSFVPLGQETYFIAAAHGQQERVNALTTFVAGHVSRMAGYARP